MGRGEYNRKNYCIGAFIHYALVHWCIDIFYIVLLVIWFISVLIHIYLILRTRLKNVSKCFKCLNPVNLENN